MTISLIPVQFDHKLVQAQLRMDLRDDWFPDPLRFEDMFDGGHVEFVLKENLQKHDGEFQPSTRTLYNIPKSNFTLRYALETSLAERALYHALAMRLLPLYDPHIPWNVFNHRASHKPSSRYLFRRAIPAWQDFTGVVRDALANSQVLLSTDLTNYFENINLCRLKSTLIKELPVLEASPAEKAAIRIHISALFEYLESWCYSESAGLPQNRDASSFLANVYMLPVDRFMLADGYQYFRYMDDIKIVCSSEHDARKTLKVLSLQLRKLGLSVNSGKTRIVPVADGEAINDCLDAGDPDLQRIDSIWQTRSLRPIRRSFPLLSELARRQLRMGKVGSRTFRYCVKRLEALASCPEFEVPETYFSQITPLVIDALSEFPASTDELAKYIRAVPTTDADLAQVSELLRDGRRNFYTWQNYRLWMLLVQKGFRNADLLGYAMEVVRTQEDNATRCGATLYAGAFGNKNDRIEVAKRFRTLGSYIGQRSAILAVQELHFSPHIRDHIAPWLRDDLKNVYRMLKRRGDYVAPPLPMPITRVLDRESDYD